MAPCNSPSAFIDSTTRQLDEDIARLIRKYQGAHGFEDQLFIPSQENLSQVQDQLGKLRTRVKQSSLPDFWRHHFQSVLGSFGFNLDEHRRMPHHYLSKLAGDLRKIEDLEGEDCLTHCQRVRNRLAQVEQMTGELEDRLPELAPTSRQELINTAEPILKAAASLEGAPSRVQSYLGDEDSRRFFQGLARTQEAVQKLARAAHAAEGGKEDDDSSPPFWRVVAESLELDLDYILDWYQEDFEQRWQEYVEGAARLGGEDHPTRVLETLSPPFTSAETMLEEGRTILEQVREAARSYVRLPDGEECQVVATPDYLEFCPTAVYMGGNVHEEELRGRIGLNAENFAAFSRASLWGTMAHEGYPGHHTHFILSGQQRLPETFLLYLPLSRPLVEGVAHRTEMLMAPSHEDDVARLATARRVLFCAARVRAVMELNYHQRPADDIFHMYHRQLKVNEYTARSQVRAHQRMPGDALSFYTGARMLREWEAKLGYDAAAFTQMICSFGFVGINTMGAILRLTEEEREALLSFRT